jgi:hypothetical protein
MSDEHGDRPWEKRDAPPIAPEAATTGEAPPPVVDEAGAHASPAAAFRQTALWLAALLALVIAGLGLSPFWAPVVAPLLPWGAKTAPMAEGYDAFASRLTALERRPEGAASNVDAVKSALAAQTERVDRLEAALAADRQNQAQTTANKSALEQLTQRVAAIEAQTASKAAESEKAVRELGRLGTAATDLGERLSALEQRARAQVTTDRAGTALLLAELQMREAVEEGRPFAAAYGAFTKLARDDPMLIAGAAPLSAAARDGVASRIVLRRELADLAGELARAGEPAGNLRWWQQALDRIKRVVTIRRIGGSAHAGPQAAVSTAQSALAGGDLAAAVSALGSLNGADAELAQPWLRMARDRLAAEAALAHLQQALAAHLGAASTPPPAAPGVTPAPPGATPRTPS